MKMVFTNPSLVPCDRLKGELDGRGLRVFIKNEFTAATLGLGQSLLFMWPEVWVADEDYEAAAAINAQMENAVPSINLPWTCKHCGETVDAELDSCWKCETPKEQ